MVKKGTVINILNMGLVFIEVLLIYAVLHPFSQPPLEEYARTDIYMMKNAMDSSELYMKSAFDFSVYQAIYDIAKNGGLNRTSTNRWDKVLEEGDFVPNVKAEITRNFNSYTSKGYKFLDLPSLVGLPKYDEKEIGLAESDGGIRISLAEGTVSIHKRDEEEVIFLESPFSVEKVYGIDLFGMYEKARQFYNQVRNSCESFSKEGEERETPEGDFEIKQKVLSLDKTATGCKAEVRISITEKDPEEFPVFNGTDVSFEPVSFEFLVETT